MTEYTYDDDGLLTSLIRPDGTETRFTYDAHGNTTQFDHLTDEPSTTTTTRLEYSGSFD